MRVHARKQLGATNWAFIITLVLLLVFIWLWYAETDKHDKMAADLKAAEAKEKAINTEAVKIIAMIEELSSKVGWVKINVPLKAISRGQMNFLMSDWKAIASHANPEGTLAGGEDGAAKDGLLKQILAEASLQFDREARLHTTKTGEETVVDYSTLSTAFKEKLGSVVEKYEDLKLSSPTPPADPDDTEGRARYERELEEYRRKVAEYDTAVKELTEMDSWAEYSARIRAPGTWGALTAEGVKVAYYRYTDTGNRTLEAAIEDLPSAFRRMKQEIAAYIDASNELIRQLRADKKAKEDALAAANTQLQTEQEAHTNDVTQLQTQLTEANDGRNRNMIEKTEAEQKLAREKDDRVKVENVLRREIDARKEQNRLLKEKRDLVISRDDVDGTILASNPILRSATIDLGHSDKVYVGQKFVVSALDRGGNRINTGEIVIVRVTGKHSAQVRVLNGSIGDGYRIHNPLFRVGEQVKVFFAAKLDKWPKEMARERLAKLNVIVQDEMDGSTHYVVVPNSWAAPAMKSAEDEEDMEDEGAVLTTPLEEVQKRARIFGANVITEKLLDAFLDY